MHRRWVASCPLAAVLALLFLSWGEAEGVPPAGGPHPGPDAQRGVEGARPAAGGRDAPPEGKTLGRGSPPATGPFLERWAVAVHIPGKEHYVREAKRILHPAWAFIHTDRGSSMAREAHRVAGLADEARRGVYEDPKLRAHLAAEGSDPAPAGQLPAGARYAPLRQIDLLLFASAAIAERLPAGCRRLEHSGPAAGGAMVVADVGDENKPPADGPRAGDEAPIILGASGILSRDDFASEWPRRLARVAGGMSGLTAGSFGDEDTPPERRAALDLVEQLDQEFAAAGWPVRHANTLGGGNATGWLPNAAPARCFVVVDAAPRPIRWDALRNGFMHSMQYLAAYRHLPLLQRYARVVRSDGDVFLTPRMRAWRPSAKVVTGRGWYSAEQETRRRLEAIAAEMGLVHLGVFNVGATWVAPPLEVRTALSIGLRVAHRVVVKHQQRADGRPAAWPGWWPAVASMYAGELALNHMFALAGAKQLPRVTSGTVFTEPTPPPGESAFLRVRGDILDGKSDAAGAASTHQVVHIHCWHGATRFDKFKFWQNGYQRSQYPELSLNIDTSRDYATWIALYFSDKVL